MKDSHILIGHGAGGRLTHKLIESIFVKHFKNDYLQQLNDSSIIETGTRIAFTTDSYVIDPIFFPGGDIGTLAISGTVNDLLVSGAVPQYLSAGFIIEEGFEIAQLEKIVVSMAKEARKAGVSVVTGDTKVVKRGQCDKLFINTAGVGRVLPQSKGLNAQELSEGDKVIISGFLGDHAIAILSSRENIQFENAVLSDAAPLTGLVLPVMEKFGTGIKYMRDITRGGIATVLNEACANKSFGIELQEKNIPIRSEVEGICEVFGYDPLYLANEGKIVIIVSSEAADRVVEYMKLLPFGKDAVVAGEVTHRAPGKVSLKSVIGGSRIVDMLAGEMLPRIC